MRETMEFGKWQELNKELDIDLLPELFSGSMANKWPISLERGGLFAHLVDTGMYDT